MNDIDPVDSEALLGSLRSSGSSRSEAAADRVLDGLLRAASSQSTPGELDTAAEVVKRVRAESHRVVALPGRTEQDPDRKSVV